MKGKLKGEKPRGGGQVKQRRDKQKRERRGWVRRRKKRKEGRAGLCD